MRRTEVLPMPYRQAISDLLIWSRRTSSARTKFAFYTRDPKARNYGGSTLGLRWLFWLIPFWLVLLPQASGYCIRVLEYCKIRLRSQSW
jgi:hypothetical protein